MIFARFVIGILSKSVAAFCYNYREQVATNRFFEIDLSIKISRFNSTFHYSHFIFNAINAHLRVDGGRYPAKFFVVNVSALSFDFGNSFRLEVWKNIVKNLIQFFEFFFV